MNSLPVRSAQSYTVFWKSCKSDQIYRISKILYNFELTVREENSIFPYDSFFIAKVYFNILYSAILVVEYYRYMVVFRASVTLEDFTSSVVFDILSVAMNYPNPPTRNFRPIPFRGKKPHVNPISG